MGEMLNAQRTAALALVSPNLSSWDFDRLKPPYLRIDLPSGHRLDKASDHRHVIWHQAASEAGGGAECEDRLATARLHGVAEPADVGCGRRLLDARSLGPKLGVLGCVPKLILFSLIGCLVMIGLIFRSVMIAVRGLVTIVFTLAVVYMAAHGVFQLGWLRNLGMPLGGTEGRGAYRDI